MNSFWVYLLPAAGMLSSLAFAAWPTWFIERLDRRDKRRRLYKPLCIVLFFSGLFGWHSFFQAGARLIFHIEGSHLATILTGAILFLIYTAALRGEALAEEAKRRRQSERNAARH